MSTRHFLLFVLVCLAWGMSVIAAKIAVTDLRCPPLFFAFLRMALVAAVLVPRLRPLPEGFGRVLTATLLMGGGSFALLFIGLRTSSASSAAIVSLLLVPLTVLFAVLFLGERVGWQRSLGMALTLAGVVTVIGSPAEFHGSAGLFYVAGSAVTGALGSVLLKQLKTQPLVLQAWVGTAGALLLLPLSLVLESGQVAAVQAGGWPLLACLAFSGLVVSVFAHTIYYGMLQRYDANLVVPLSLMTPVFTILLGVVIYDEAVTRNLIIGGLLAMAGVTVLVARPFQTLPKWATLRGRIDF